MGGVTSTIAAKFAFFPPQLPPYTVVTVTDSDRSVRLRIPGYDPTKGGGNVNVEVMKLRTRRRVNRVVSAHVSHPKAGATMLSSHWNSADWGADAVAVRGVKQAIEVE